MSGGEPRDISRRRQPPDARLQLIGSAPVMTVRGPRVPGVFSYTNDEWVKVVAANTDARRLCPTSWKPDANLHQLLIALEAAGQQYRISRRDRSQRRALISDVLQAWRIATGDIALKISHTDGRPAGPLIRYLDSVLRPILGEEDMVGHETLVQAIRSARRRKSG
jgi:hypothetical protein